MVSEQRPPRALLTMPTRRHSCARRSNHASRAATAAALRRARAYSFSFLSPFPHSLARSDPRARLPALRPALCAPPPPLGTSASRRCAGCTLYGRFLPVDVKVRARRAPAARTSLSFFSPTPTQAFAVDVETLSRRCCPRYCRACSQQV